MDVIVLTERRFVGFSGITERFKAY